MRYGYVGELKFLYKEPHIKGPYLSVESSKHVL
jgi:hypothetical protein